MRTTLLTYTHAGMLVDVWYDMDAEDPRSEQHNLGTLIGWKPAELTIGDPQISLEYTTAAEALADLERTEKPRLIFPVFYSSHGPQCRLNMGEGTDPDSLKRSAGVVFVTAEKIRDEFAMKRISAVTLRKATEALKAEIAEYSAYLTGATYGYTIRDRTGHRWHIDHPLYGMDVCEAEANVAAEDAAQRHLAETVEAYEMACRDIQTITPRDKGAVYAA